MSTPSESSTDSVRRDRACITGMFHYPNMDRWSLGGCVLTRGNRGWPFETAYPPVDVREDVGLGHLLHFCIEEGMTPRHLHELSMLPGPDTKALLCPMMVHMREREDMSKRLEDLPEDAITESVFALGLIQAPDREKVEWDRRQHEGK